MSETAEGHEILSMVRRLKEIGIVRLGREFKTRVTDLKQGLRNYRKAVTSWKETRRFKKGMDTKRGSWLPPKANRKRRLDGFQKILSEAIFNQRV